MPPDFPPKGLQTSTSDAIPTPAHDFPTVGIGASAGGVGALQEFFRTTPAESRMAFVVILHLSPEHDSQLAALLQPATAKLVAQVTALLRPLGQSFFMAPSCIYLAFVTHAQGDAEATRALLAEARRYAEASGRPRGLTLSLCKSAWVANDHGQPDTAEPLAREAVRIGALHKDRWGFGWALFQRPVRSWRVGGRRRQPGGRAAGPGGGGAAHHRADGPGPGHHTSPA